MTPFTRVYDAFFARITDDMYMEISEEQTRADCKGLLLGSLPLFEFPNEVIDIVEVPQIDGTVIDYFSRDISLEEVNILATGMNQIWLQRQINSIESTRQKFSGPDFKLTSQASHLQRLMALFTQVRDEHRRLQMLHSRRRISGGKYVSNFGKFVERMN